ncbi:hypothetical protein T492DRAFT_447432 [Pavlovales sp. CCMP2436]|nr:hypothetical protein T492DRAFT_447432 [Pavlovales sp. CCMP2436]
MARPEQKQQEAGAAQKASTHIQSAARGKSGRKRAAAAAREAGLAPVHAAPAVLAMRALQTLRHERELWLRTVPEQVHSAATNGRIALRWAPFPMPVAQAGAEAVPPCEYKLLVQSAGFGPFEPLPEAQLAPADGAGVAGCELCALVASASLRLVVQVLLASSASEEAGEAGRRYRTAPSLLLATPAAASLAELAASVQATLTELQAVQALPASAGLASARLDGLAELLLQTEAAAGAAGAAGAHVVRGAPTVRARVLTLALESADDASDLTLGAIGTQRASAAPLGASSALRLEPCDGFAALALANDIPLAPGDGAEGGNEGVPRELGAEEEAVARVWLASALGGARASSVRLLADLTVAAAVRECPMQLVGQGTSAHEPPGCVRLVQVAHVTAVVSLPPLPLRPALAALPARLPSAYLAPPPQGAHASGWWAWRRRAVVRALHAAAAAALSPVLLPLPAALDGAAREVPAAAPAARSGALQLEWVGGEKLAGLEGTEPAARCLRALLARATSVALVWQGGTLTGGAGVAQLRAWPVDGLAAPPRALGGCVLRVGDAGAIRAEVSALRRVRALGGAVVCAATCEPMAVYDPSQLSARARKALGTGESAAPSGGVSRRPSGAGRVTLAGVRLAPPFRATSGWGAGEPYGRSAAAGALGCVRALPPCWSVKEIVCRFVHAMEPKLRCFNGWGTALASTRCPPPPRCSSRRRCRPSPSRWRPTREAWRRSTSWRTTTCSTHCAHRGRPGRRGARRRLPSSPAPLRSTRLWRGAELRTPPRHRPYSTTWVCVTGRGCSSG